MGAEIQNKTQLPPDVERNLIGTWLKDEGTESIKQFKASHFPVYSELFKALSAGKSALEIANANIGYTHGDIIALMDAANPIFYKQALKKASDILFTEKAGILLSTYIANRDLRAFVDQAEALMTYGNIPLSEKDGVERLLAELEYKRTEKAIKYGLPTLDKMTGGIHRKELTTVAARPGVGKSSFALQVATLAQKLGEKVLYFTLEMPYEQQLKRLAIQTKLSTTEEFNEFSLNTEAEYYLRKIEKEHKLLFYENVNNLPEICAAIRSQRPYLVIIDQLTQVKIRGQRWKSRLEELQEITATLKRVSMSENVAIMLLCQINRDAANSEPTLANLKGSGQIEEDSDNVILIHRTNGSGDSDFAKEILLKLDKQRGGETGRYNILFAPKFYRFYEIAD